MQVDRDARGLLVSGPSRLVIRCKISGTKDEESRDQLEQSCSNQKRCLEFVFSDADHAGDLNGLVEWELCGGHT